MQPTDYIAALQRDGNRIAAVAHLAGLGRGVPSCPGWTIADLVWHVGNAHTFWRGAATGAVAGPDTYQEPPRPDEKAVVQWFRDGLRDTVDTLGRVDPSTPAWTWGRRKEVGFILRRVAHETAVHRWDAETAGGADVPIEKTLAADGVAEFLDDVLPGMSNDLDGPVQVIALRANDIDVDWTVRAGGGACESAPAAASADVRVSASASDLVLLLWGRRRIAQVEIDGDVAALNRFLARATF
ncbi:maleylpyruvate isomerase family mycothiol-dependent enzyme [Mycobacterium szulgai]|uniref:Mycothiol-dependent maleylpyruvate isomerase metal-binding domain-containing protein n=1 Tax=Mycobacterium szulgai TaxID=1787 RepID=A0A1X2EJ57_MYCSZ|nr:maleylpyruvate isomerase family mycothiol-dependent enzyme [Mycobacterium szulgai]ORX03540.1 hypothetical protein AWC27_27770 [Mycobacterium szulgai]